jgi:hypothetical protein
VIISLDNSQLLFVFKDPQDLTRLEDLDSRPSKDLLSTESESEEEEERDQFTRERLWESPRTKVSTNSNLPETSEALLKKELEENAED